MPLRNFGYVLVLTTGVIFALAIEKKEDFFLYNNTQDTVCFHADATGNNSDLNQITKETDE